MNDTKDHQTYPTEHRWIGKLRPGLEVVYWLVIVLFLLAAFRIDTGIGLAEGLGRATGGIALDVLTSIPFTTLAAKARPDIPFAAQYVGLLYLVMFTAHLLLLILLVPRMRAGSSGLAIGEDDSFERYLLRNVYVFFPSLNIVSFFESLRVILGSARDQQKQFGLVFSKDILGWALTRNRAITYACLVAICFFVMPLIPGGFGGRVLSMPFSFYAALMVTLQVNVVFEAVLIALAYLKKG